MLRRHSFDLPSCAFESHRKAASLKNRAQLVHAFEIGTENYEKNVQGPKRGPSQTCKSLSRTALISPVSHPLSSSSFPTRSHSLRLSPALLRTPGSRPAASTLHISIRYQLLTVRSLKLCISAPVTTSASVAHIGGHSTAIKFHDSCSLPLLESSPHATFPRRSSLPCFFLRLSLSPPAACCHIAARPRASWTAAAYLQCMLLLFCYACFFLTELSAPPLFFLSVLICLLL